MNAFFCPIICLCLLLAPKPSLANQQPEAIWLWPAAYAKMEQKQAGEVFLLQAHYSKIGNKRIPRGPAPHAWQNVKLHLVFRLARSPNEQEIVQHFLTLAARWERAAVPVVGLQLDYDSPTARTANYAAALNRVRGLLPAKYKLSATGLADWLQPRNPAFKGVGQIEIIFQMYQEKLAHRNTAPYLLRLNTWPTPFRLGLLPDQQLSATEISALQANPHFHGIVRFHGG